MSKAKIVDCDWNEIEGARFVFYRHGRKFVCDSGDVIVLKGDVEIGLAKWGQDAWIYPDLNTAIDVVDEMAKEDTA